MKIVRLGDSTQHLDPSCALDARRASIQINAVTRNARCAHVDTLGLEVLPAALAGLASMLMLKEVLKMLHAKSAQWVASMGLREGASA